MIVMYGCPPEDTSPRVPDITTPHVPWIPTFEPSGARQLSPCPTCKRHVVVGTECPFCHADSRDERLLAVVRERDAALARIAEHDREYENLKRDLVRAKEERETARAYLALLKSQLRALGEES